MVRIYRVLDRYPASFNPPCCNAGKEQETFSALHHVERESSSDFHVLILCSVQLTCRPARDAKLPNPRSPASRSKKR
jgi:hypothetical protein